MTPRKRIRRPPTSNGRLRRLTEQSLLAVVALVLALGVTLSVFALYLLHTSPSTTTRLISAVLGSFAGGLVGASLTILVNMSLDHNALTQVREILEQTVSSTLTSPDAELLPLRITWYHYHQTLIGGRPTWRMSRFRFDTGLTIGSLSADVPVVDISVDTPRMYRVEAALRGSRLILTQAPLDGREAPVIEIFPEIRGTHQVHAGIAIMESWDGPHILTPALLSRTALMDPVVEGSIGNERNAELERIWKREFVAIRNLLPRSRRTQNTPMRQ